MSFLSPYGHRALVDTFVPLRLNRHYRTTERSEVSLPPVILTTLCRTLARHNTACSKGIVTFYSDWHFLQGPDSPLGPVLTLPMGLARGSIGGDAFVSSPGLRPVCRLHAHVGSLMSVEDWERLSFCQPVRQLICSGTINECANTRLYFLANVVPMHANVLRALACNRV